MHDANKSAALTAELLIKANRLLLTYSVANLGDAEIYLFNRMYDDVDDDGKYRVGKDVCNIETVDDVVLVSKKIPAVPQFMLVESPNIPCVTALAARQSFAETIEMDLPLKPWTPYAALANPSRRNTLPLFFELGYFVGRDGTRALAKHVPTVSGHALRFAPFSIASQSLLRVGPFERVEVLAG